MARAPDKDLAYFLGNCRKSEKQFDIKPPLVPQFECPIKNYHLERALVSLNTEYILQLNCSAFKWNSNVEAQDIIAQPTFLWSWKKAVVKAFEILEYLKKLSSLLKEVKLKLIWQRSKTALCSFRSICKG